MFKERRTHVIPPDNWIEHQLSEWKWDSHLWTKNQYDQLTCDWCGWIPPTECPITVAKVCPDNPAIEGLV